MFTRRSFLSLAVAAAQNRQHNIVLFLVDDLGAHDLKTHGAPNLEAFAKTAVTFTQAYSAAPVCSPTRASILTGKHPARLGITTWHESAMDPQTPQGRKMRPADAIGNLPLSEYTLAEALRDQGYATGHVGKWHLGTAEYAPETQGFDFNIGGTHWGAPATYFHPFKAQVRKEYRYVPGLPWTKPGDYLTDALTNAAIDAIRHWKTQSKPYFLNLWHHTPHTPTEGKPQDGGNTYKAMIRNLDAEFGRLLKEIDPQNTIVVFASDNGGYLPVTTNAPLRSGKGSLYEGGIRIPLMIRWPGITKPGTTCDTPVVTTDLFPTLSNTNAVDGINLKPLLSGNTIPARDLHFHYPHYYHAPQTTPVGAIRSGNLKLIEFFEENNRCELYDLAADPSEQQDLAQKQPEKAKELQQKLHAWRKQVGARMPTPLLAANPPLARPYKPHHV
ncbi:N-acetylgalactosamine-6-sulfatase [Bryobacterales bacterium F-183]|nr:N-acetylgalactosamine-6-sulfatase [Bryobacterales bacterium F-183]